MELPKNQSRPQSRYWTKLEHQKFLEALAKFGHKDVKSISSYVGTRTPIQVRTHSQKYFLRLKRCTNERTFLEEYPNKAPENPDIVPVKSKNVSSNNFSPTTHYPNIPSNTTQSAPPPPSNFTNPSPPVSNITTSCISASSAGISPITNYRSCGKITSSSTEQKAPKVIRSLSKVISPIIKSNLSELVKKLVPKKDPVGVDSLVYRKFTKDDISKLSYAMKVYKHIKDYSTKINCIQRHFFPKKSTEELHLFITEFMAENPQASLDFYLSPSPCSSPQDSLDDLSKEINFEKEIICSEQDIFLVNNNVISPFSLSLQEKFVEEDNDREMDLELEDEEELGALSLASPKKKPKRSR